ncbi:MAG: hypothetical protein K6A32_03375 [Bacteroidales bacterium]|nr:hypothetical protein [Bacteroidales bacterium]
MLPRLLYFNPENDLALAANDAHYTPPASALKMATDLERLPLRWAREDDLVLLRNGSFIDAGGHPAVLPDFGMEAKDHSSLEPKTGSTAYASRSRRSLALCPWGWSPLTVATFRRAGIPDSLLPTEVEVQAFRSLAGRSTSFMVLTSLRKRLDELGLGHLFTGEAHICRSSDEALGWHNRFGETLFKQPWSGSGRGLLHARQGRLTEKHISWLKRTLRGQGYVMAEPYYDKRLDFAMEFWRHRDGSVTYEGLSLFMTTAGGVYAGNIVGTEEEKRDRLALAMPALFEGDSPLYTLLSSLLATELAALPDTFYEGPIGVDMLITADGRIDPCVEINFRMTMGWLALHF